MKAKQGNLHAHWAKMDADREKWRADMKAFNEMMDRREAERKADEEKRMAERGSRPKKENPTSRR
jgi:hypothetical protein